MAYFPVNSNMIESLTRTNDKLRCRTNSLVTQIENLEAELQKLQSVNNLLEQKAWNAESQINNYKSKFHV